MPRSRTKRFLLGHLRCLPAISLGACALLSHPGPAQAACQLSEAAEFPVTLKDNRPMIPISIAGHDMRMMLDTAAGTSYIWGSVARELNLESQKGRYSWTVNGAGGEDTIVGTISVKDFKLADLTVPKITLYEAARWSMPKDDAGVLGEDLLHSYDLDIDLRSRKIRLFVPKGCNGDQVVYWAKAYFMAKLERSSSSAHRVQVSATLDGRPQTAIFDTGAERTVVSTRAARQEHIDVDTPAPTGSTDTPIALFHTLTIGQETIHDAKLGITNLFDSGPEMQMGAIVGHYVSVDAPDLVIGADFFLAHRVYISRSQEVVYFTYEGGPAFQSPTLRAREASAAGDNGTGQSKPP